MDAEGSRELERIREGIRSRYATYHALDRDRFPDLDFNTNRANYEPLRVSFELEFYEVRKLDRAANTIHIPSTYTLAQLFTDEKYVPTSKILNTCRLYALLEPDQTTIDKKAPFSLRTRNRRVWWVGLALVILSLVTYVAVSRLTTPQTPTDLAIQTPRPGQTVGRSVEVKGRVNGAGEVWLVVHPNLKDEKYYVQEAVPIQADGSWEAEALLGPVKDYSTDVFFQLRAFVNPKGTYETFYTKGENIFNAWPEQYEVASKPIVLIRKGRKKIIVNSNKVASQLVIDAPRPRQAVARTMTVTGRVNGADEVWLVVHPTAKDDDFYYLQDVALVSPNGSWEGKIIVGPVEEISSDRFFELRAFVRPKGTYERLLKQGEFKANAWPETYELATKPVVIIRKGTAN